MSHENRIRVLQLTNERPGVIGLTKNFGVDAAEAPKLLQHCLSLGVFEGLRPSLIDDSIGL